MFRECNLEICGRGAVTPRGAGVGALLEAGDWKTQRGPSLEAKLEGPEAFRVDLHQKALVRWQENPRLRRGPPIAIFMMEAARQALDGAAVKPEKLGIVAAFSSGCIVYSRRFFQDTIREGRRFGSPLLFPETVYNAPASHVAAVLGVSGPCYSLVGDESAWATAIATAACWLEMGAVDHALVIGAEEIDAISLEAFKAVGWIGPRKKFVAAEGAGALLLSRAGVNSSARITGVAEGFFYRSRAGARKAAEECLRACPSSDPIYPTAGHGWMAPFAAKLAGDRATPSPLPYCGQAFSASSAWQTLRAIHALEPRGGKLLLPFWGLNAQVSALQLSLEKKEL